MAISIRDALQRARSELKQTSTSADLDAEVILAAALNKPRSHLRAWPEQEVSSDQQAQCQDWVNRRQLGTPMAYLLGYRDFWKHRFHVGPDVLIPRADTEILVETALDRLASMTAPRLLDLGTGSGAIAISLALDCPQAQVTATDLSSAALAIATLNANNLGAHGIRFVHSDWFENLADNRFDLIVSNPPYIDPQDPHLRQGDLLFEPPQALIAPNHGLQDLQTLIEQSRNALHTDGWLLLEHGYDQSNAVAELFAANGYRHIQHRRDLNQHIRVTLGQAPA